MDRENLLSLLAPCNVFIGCFVDTEEVLAIGPINVLKVLGSANGLHQVTNRPSLILWYFEPRNSTGILHKRQTFVYFIFAID